MCVVFFLVFCLFVCLSVFVLFCGIWGVFVHVIFFCFCLFCVFWSVCFLFCFVFTYLSTRNKAMSKQRAIKYLWTIYIQRLDTMIQYVCLSPKPAWRGRWNPVKLNRLFCYERLRSIIRLIQPQTILWDCQHMGVYITKNSYGCQLFGILYMIPRCCALLSGCDSWWRHQMETNFRVTGPLWGESTGHRWFPSQWPVTRGFGVFFDLPLKKTAEQIIEMSVILDTIAVIMASL